LTWQSLARVAYCRDVYWQPRSELSRVRFNADDGPSYHVQLTAAGCAAHLAARDLFQPVLHEVTQRVRRGATDTRRPLRTLHEIVSAASGG
jgi:hypothetical protein